MENIEENQNKDFTNKNYDNSEEDYRNEFLRRRAEISKLTFNKGSIEIEDIYAEEYLKQCELAVGGDVVAQDLLSYWFKHGNPALPENVDMSMKWLIFASSNGNDHSITKLALFLNYAYDEIVDSEYFDDLLDVLYLTKYNYQYMLGKVICRYMVYDLHLDALEMAKEKPVKKEYNQLSMQRFTESLNRVMPDVHEFFRSYIKNENGTNTNDTENSSENPNE